MKTLFTLLLFSTCFIAQAQTPDPGDPGPYAVEKRFYDLGELAFDPDSFAYDVELIANVHFPDYPTAGPFPMVMLMHGRHSTCYRTSNPSFTQLNWPCPTGYESIESFIGYDYLAEHLASHGFLVVSISANAINADDASHPDRGMHARGQLMQEHLNLWNTWNTTVNPIWGDTMIGLVDLNNVGTMGHSRGGEGVMWHAIHNQRLGSPYKVKAVLPLAPTDFYRKKVNDIPILNIAPYCDGDVSDLQGVHFFDDVRFRQPDEAPKHNLLVMGANHNFYNTAWTPGLYIAGTADDWDRWRGDDDVHCGSLGSAMGRLSPAGQQANLTAYATAFFRYYLDDRKEFWPILSAQDIIPPTSTGADQRDVYMSFKMKTSKRLDINRTDTESSESTNTLGGAVSYNGLITYDICADDAGENDCSNEANRQEPHAQTSSILGMSQLQMEWDSPDDYWNNAIPTGYQDLSDYSHFQFRAGVDFPNNSSAADLDFTITLFDADGLSASTLVTDHSTALFHQPGTENNYLPKIMHNTIKVPLLSYDSTLDMENITDIRFEFDQSVSGAILVSDLTVTDEGFPGYVEQPPSSIDEVHDLYELKIGPNPTDGMVQFDWRKGEHQITEIEVFDLNGRRLASYATQGLKMQSIDLSSFPQATYIIRLQGDKGSSFQEIIKFD